MVSLNAAEGEVFRDYLVNKTTDNFLRHYAKLSPDKTALIAGGQKISYRQLDENVCRAAAVFNNLGIKKGDIVSVQLPNWAEFVIVFYALAKIGAIINPVHITLRQIEIENILNFSESKLWVIPSEFRGFNFVKMAESVCQSCTQLNHVVVVGREVVPKGMTSFKKLMSSELAEFPASVGAAPDDPLYLIYTSGTTGNPKGVLHSFNTALYQGVYTNNELESKDDEVVLIVAPLSYTFGLVFGLFVGLVNGLTVVLLEHFDAQNALKLISQYHVTRLAAVPTHIIAILNDPGFLPEYCKSLRIIEVGAALTPPDVIENMKKEIGCDISHAYGLTECPYLTYSRPHDPYEKICASVGRAAPGVQIAIVDESNQTVDVGAIGEIVAKGPGMFLGYFKNQHATAQSFDVERWFHTGDLGYLDDEAWLHIAGRKNDIIIRGGQNIYPKEIEDVLYAHPEILEAAVIGIPDPKYGERTCAVIVKKEGANLKREDEIKEYCKQRLAIFKVPEKVIFVEDLPHTPSGKIHKIILRDKITEKA